VGPFELRWLVRPGWDGPESVLQYRTTIKVTDYGSVDHILVDKVTDWKDVPIVDETNGKNENIY
jgi:hypothetical protein